MSGLCQWLGITGSDSLKFPTVLGNETAGNSHDGIALTKVSSASVGRWTERIAPEEARVIEFHFSRFMHDHRYDRRFTDLECQEDVAAFYRAENTRFFYNDPL